MRLVVAAFCPASSLLLAPAGSGQLVVDNAPILEFVDFEADLQLAPGETVQATYHGSLRCDGPTVPPPSCSTTWRTTTTPSFRTVPPCAWAPPSK